MFQNSRLHIFVTLLIACATLVAASDADPKNITGLLMPGEFHGDEVRAKDGETWMAVSVTGQRTTVTPVHLRVEPCFDSVLDDPAKKVMTGKNVSSAESVADVQFFVKDLPGIASGQVKTVSQSVDIKPNVPLELKVEQGTGFVLECVCFRPKEMDGAFDGSLILRMGGQSQVLATGTITFSGSTSFLGDDAAWTLLWAGDINRDGMPDFLIDLTNHYNVSNPTLFLSEGSIQKPSVRKVASQLSVGC